MMLILNGICQYERNCAALKLSRIIFSSTEGQSSTVGAKTLPQNVIKREGNYSSKLHDLMHV